MITSIVSIVFALTFPKTYMDLPSTTDLVHMEIKSREIQRINDEYLAQKESLDWMRVSEKQAMGLYEELNQKPTRTAKSTPTRGVSRDLEVFTVTCYDLSVQSCGKPVGHKNYGITASGFNLAGHTWETARAIAVDPKIIPLGSKVRVTFINENYSKYDGIYTTVDTGGAIKGNKIDFFLGDYNQNKTHQDVWDFGVTEAYVELLKGDD